MGRIFLESSAFFIIRGKTMLEFIEEPTNNTLIVNLFSGPGGGKSSSAAYIFSQLKQQHIKCELAVELAKELVYDKSYSVLRCQPYVFGQQLWRVERLIGQVDVVITDSPVILSMVYNSHQYPPSFNLCVLDIFNRMNNRNYFLERNKPYFNYGRTQTEEEARHIDQEIAKLLDVYSIEYERITPDVRILDLVVLDIMSALKNNKANQDKA